MESYPIRDAQRHIANAEAKYEQWRAAQAKVEEYENGKTATYGKYPALAILGRAGTAEYFQYKGLTGPRDWYERELAVEIAMAQMYTNYAVYARGR
jgi:hypothetical protein